MKDLEKFLDPTKAQNFGDALKDAFGGAGSALIKLTTALDAYGRHQAEIEKQRGNAAKSYLNGLTDEKKFQQQLSDINEKDTKGRLSAYGDMAGAAAGFFDEQSSGYKTLMAVSQAFHAVELAMTLAEMVPKAITAVLNQANGDPYTAFGRMAAMAAIVAGLGVAVGGGGGGGASGMSAAEVQKKQGTGTVLGDSEAKSDSVKKALDLIGKNSDVTLVYTQQMARSLQSIESGIGGLANAVFRANGAASGNVAGFQNSKEIGGTLLNKIDTMLGGIVGTILSILPKGISNKISEFVFGSVTKTLIDSGFLARGTFGQLSQGQGLQQYGTVKTEEKGMLGGLFGGNDTHTDPIYEALSTDMQRQFALIFTGIGTSLRAAASVLGMDGDTVLAALNKINIDLPLSLKDLKGAELETAINNWISGIGDTVAEQVIPGLKEFQHVGEGYYETIIRVATGLESARATMESLGIKAIEYTEVLNKQGDVFTEMSRQSIHNFETTESPSTGGIDSRGNGTAGTPSTLVTTGIGQIIDNFSGSGPDLIALYKTLVDIREQFRAFGAKLQDVTIDMIKGAGGLDALNQGVSDFYSKFYTASEQTAAQGRTLTDTFKGIGVALPVSRKGFRELVEGIDTSTASGQKLYGQLIKNAGATDAYYSALEESFNSALQAAGISASNIAGVIQNGLMGEISSADVGRQIGEMVVNGVYSALANNVSGVISQIIMDTLITPLMTAVMAEGATAATINAAVSQASIDAMIESANTAINALTEIFNNPAFKALMEKLKTAFGAIGFNAVPYVPPVVGNAAGGGSGGSAGYAGGDDGKAYRDALKSIGEDIRKFGEALAHLGETSYDAAVRQIQDAARAKAEQMAGMDQSGAIADARAQAKAGAQKTFDDWMAAAIAEAAKNNPPGQLIDLNSLAGYQAAINSYKAAMEAAGKLTIDNTAILNDWAKAQIDLLNAQNKIKAAAITDDLGKQITRTGMTPLEIQIADINGKALDYLKSLADLGQTTADNTAEVERWRLAMLAMIEAKGAIDTMKDLVEQIDKIKGFGTGIRDMMDELRAAGPGFDSVAASAAKVSELWGDLGKLKADASTEDRLTAAGKLKDAIMANYDAELAALQKNQGERMKALQDQQAAEKAAMDKNLTNLQAVATAMQGVADYAKSMLLGAQTTLSPILKMVEAQSQYEANLAKAKGGDAAAIANFQKFADEALKDNQAVNASSQVYAEFFNRVLKDAQGLGTGVGGAQTSAESAQAAMDIATAEWQKQIADLQKVFDTETMALQNKTIAELQKIAALTDGWQAELTDHLNEQAIAFSHLNLTASQIATLLTGVDVRIGDAVAMALSSAALIPSLGLGAGGNPYTPPNGSGVQTQGSSESPETAADRKEQTDAIKAQTAAVESQNKLLENLIAAVGDVKEGGDLNARELKQSIANALAKATA